MMRFFKAQFQKLVIPLIMLCFIVCSLFIFLMYLDNYSLSIDTTSYIILNKEELKFRYIKDFEKEIYTWNPDSILKINDKDCIIGIFEKSLYNKFIKPELQQLTLFFFILSISILILSFVIYFLVNHFRKQIGKSNGLMSCSSIPTETTHYRSNMEKNSNRVKMSDDNK